ncbi:hypothetical protein J7M23_06695, partial [Candidatus Sumerlaeota bacterium]|nr:hypothetical protein [Candidatus Sumerlaeota bacterium]
MKILGRIGINLVILYFLVLSMPVLGITITVGQGGGYDYEKIQHAINAASDGDEIIVYPGTYVENIHFDGKNIILRSTDPTSPSIVASTIIDGGQSGSVVSFSGTELTTCVLAGFTITNGKTSGSGGGICGGTWTNPTHATIKNNIIIYNSAHNGGGLAWCNGTIWNNTITTNSTQGGYTSGGGLYDCDGTILNNNISYNS